MNRLSLEEKLMDSQSLYQHVHFLSKEIGKRPAGHQGEEAARNYIKQQLKNFNIKKVITQDFSAWDTWGYTTIWSSFFGLFGGLLAFYSDILILDILGILISILGGYNLLKSAQCAKQPLSFLFKKRKSGNIIVKFSPKGSDVQKKVVLLGHTDTNKHRNTAAPSMKKYLKFTGTQIIIMPFLLALLNLYLAVFSVNNLITTLFWFFFAILFITLITVILDEKGDFVEGANDNATAVASLLEIAKHLSENKLKQTEVWVVFTGAEEVGCLGAHHLVDEYGEELKDAQFIVFEMTGSPHIVFATKNSGFSYLSTYVPDKESIDIAQQTSKAYPELKIKGKKMTFGEESGALRGRGYNAICIVGTEEDGWTGNWHRYSDTIENIEIDGVRRGATFVMKMIEQIDA